MLSLPVLAEESLRLRVGVNPNLWFSQAAVIKGEGWDLENGLDLEIIRFSGPSSNLQAFVGGQIDIMNNNAAAAILAEGSLKNTKIIAASIRGDSTLLGRGILSKSYPSRDAVKQMKAFCETRQGKLKLLTNPKGSQSDITIKLWLSKFYSDYSNCVEFIHAGDQSQLLQLFLRGDADLISAFTPIPQIFKEKDPSIGEFVSVAEIGSNQAGGVFVANQNFIKLNEKKISAFVHLIEKATTELRENPTRATRHVDDFVLKGLMPLSSLEVAIVDSREFFVSDISEMKGSIKDVYSLMKADGYTGESIDMDRWLCQ